MSIYSWVSPKIEVGKSKKLGLGTFAKAHIKKGEQIIVQGGRMMSADELDSPNFESIWYHAFQVERDVYVCPVDLKRETFDGVFSVNHSCEPTCGFKGQVTMVSIRDIKPGEEITFDYAMTDVESPNENWEGMRCLCGSKSCRGLITGNDWKLPNLRKVYKGHFSRYVQDLIDAETK